MTPDQHHRADTKLASWGTVPGQTSIDQETTDMDTNTPGDAPVNTLEAPIQFTVDIALFALDSNGHNHVLTIRRGNWPHSGKIALPGGYVDPGETSRTAAHRELVEETAVDDVSLMFLTIADDPHRDPRGRVISAVYGAVLPYMVPPAAGDDAAESAWIPARDLTTFADAGMIAFDHAHLIPKSYQLLRNP